MNRVKERKRQYILDKKNNTDPRKFIVLIKPGRDSNFQSLVNLLDEMTINYVTKYAMVDIDPKERQSDAA